MHPLQRRLVQGVKKPKSLATQQVGLATLHIEMNGVIHLWKPCCRSLSFTVGSSWIFRGPNFVNGGTSNYPMIIFSRKPVHILGYTRKLTSQTFVLGKSVCSSLSHANREQQLRYFLLFPEGFDSTMEQSKSLHDLKSYWNNTWVGRPNSADFLGCNPVFYWLRKSMTRMLNVKVHDPVYSIRGCTINVLPIHPAMLPLLSQESPRFNVHQSVARTHHVDDTLWTTTAYVYVERKRIWLCSVSSRSTTRFLPDVGYRFKQKHIGTRTQTQKEKKQWTLMNTSVYLKVFLVGFSKVSQKLGRLLNMQIYKVVPQQ